MLTVLVSIISNSQIFLQKLLTFFSKNINVYFIINDQSFNDTLTNDIVVLNNWALVEMETYYVVSASDFWSQGLWFESL